MTVWGEAASGLIMGLAMVPWTIFAAMHSAAAATARKNGSWNAPETRALTVAPIVQLPGNVTVAEPFSGI